MYDVYRFLKLLENYEELVNLLNRVLQHRWEKILVKKMEKKKITDMIGLRRKSVGGIRMFVHSNWLNVQTLQLIRMKELFHWFIFTSMFCISL